MSYEQLARQKIAYEQGERYTMNCYKIIEKYLVDNGFDGLYKSGDCACEVGDLIPCDDDCSGCEPGYKQAPDPDDPDFGDYDWIIASNKPAKKWGDESKNVNDQEQKNHEI